MDKNRQLGGPNNPANKRKLIESEVDANEMIIIDNGTQTVKIGRSGVDYPSIIIDTVAGYPKVISQNDASPSKSVYFGKQLHKAIEDKKYHIQFAYPIQSSYIQERNIDDMIALWQYALTDLMGVDKGPAKILMIDSSINSKQYKARLTEALFQKLKVHSVLFMNSSVLSLFSVGQTIGLVTEMGHGLTTTVPVFEGFILNHALEYSNVSGKLITKVLEEQLQKQNIKFKFNDKLHYSQIIKGIKEKNVKVAEDYQNEIESDQRSEEQKSYELPDGEVIVLSKETTFRPAQILFNPKMCGVTAKTLPQMLNTSLSRCSEQLRNQISKNVVFCGGSSMLQGLKQRVCKEMANSPTQLNLIFDWQRRYSSWIGGSMIGSLSTFQELAINKSNSQQLTVNEIIKRIL